MSTVISATELKNRVSEVLNDVVFRGNTAVVERYGKPVAKIVPVGNIRKSREEIRQALAATFGSLPDFTDVTKSRVPRRKKFKL